MLVLYSSLENKIASTEEVDIQNEIASTEEVDNQNEIASTEELKTVSVSANYLPFESAEHLFEEAELVVIGEPTEEFLDRNHVVTLSGDNSVEDYYTETELNIKKIIKAPSDLEISENEIFNVVEPAIGVLEDSEGNPYKIVTEDYSEMKKGMTYLIFLELNYFGDYAVTGNTIGRYNIDKKDKNDLPNSAAGVEHKMKKEKKEKFWEIFKEKFDL
ncbi:hypothetical protein [Bacillus litorisediminis]|uniref:hypothetical protein n=1 Tax=Bacillus litorisediminis TaxID=2922713 RepID=UPI001FABA319|nr:hypothetical protein [Bacillus litorisediminis]